MGYRIVRLSAEIFQQILTEGYTFPIRPGEKLRCLKGLPEGAKIEGISQDLFFNTGEYALKVSHPSWPDGIPGDDIPFLSVEFVVEHEMSDQPLVVNGET